MMEKPTPALPKGGGIMFFCPSVRNKGVGFYFPSLGEGLGVGVSPPPLGRGWGWVSVPLPWGGVGGGYQFPSLGEGVGGVVTPRMGH